QPRQHIKKQRHYFANKGPSRQSYGFSQYLGLQGYQTSQSWFDGITGLMDRSLSKLQEILLHHHSPPASVSQSPPCIHILWASDRLARVFTVRQGHCTEGDYKLQVALGSLTVSSMRHRCGGGGSGSTFILGVTVSSAPGWQQHPAKAASSLCESELHGKPNYLAGRSNGENGLSLFRTPEDACRWGRVTGRGPCLCLRGGPDLVLDPEGAAGAGEGEVLGGVPRDAPPYSCCLEPLGPVKHLDWPAGRHGQDGGSAKLKLEPGKANPFPTAPAHGTCLPYPGTQGTVHTLRSSPGSHPPRPPPGACAGRTSRALRDGHQGPVPPPTPGPFPHGGLDNRVPRPAIQRLPVGGYPAEDKLRGLLMPPGAPSHPTLSLDVPIKMESDSGSEDAADGYCMSPTQVWLGAGDLAKRQLVTFPTRMHLKTEPGARHPLYSAPPGPGLLGAPPRPSRGLVPPHPASCACLGPPPRLCVRGHQPPGLGCNCRAPGPAPTVKLEPLDSPLWAAHGQGGPPGLFCKSAPAMGMPPRDAQCAFLP
ncbi:hypothetical protein FD754_013970, partial [Muntiacus muntjak]